MKKVLSILLSFLMLAEFTLSAFAANQSVGIVSKKFAEAEPIETLSSDDGAFYEFLTTENGKIAIILAAAPKNSGG